MTPDAHHHRHDARSLRVAVLTISDTRTPADDASGDAAQQLLQAAGHHVARAHCTDDVVEIQSHALELLDSNDALVTTGGTGVAARDVTPEAFEPLWQQTWPGVGEEFRRLSLKSVGPHALLSRATAGLVRRPEAPKPAFLLPGNPDAVRLGVERLVIALLPHAIGLLHDSHAH
jgi:molybdopterin adenylyltransferase